MPRLSISLDIAANPLSFLYGTTAIYVASGLLPEFIADFSREFYKTNSGIKTFSDAITHTRASTATYVDSTGTLQTAAINEPRVGHHVWNGSAWVNEGLLHESEARTNLLTYSEDLSNAAWTKARCTVAIGGVGPDGAASLYTATATETNANGMSVADSVTISSGATTTSSGYARKGTNDWMVVVVFDEGSNAVRQWFNLANGSLGSSNTAGAGFSKVSASITEQGSGLYRWSFTAATTGTNFRVVVFPSVPADLDFDCTIGDVGYVGFVQIEQASTPSSYIPTSGSTVTRAADVLTIPAANLPWPSPVVIGPELVTNGTFDTDISGWNDLSAAGGSIAWNPAGYLDLVNATGVGRTQQPFALDTAKVYQLVVTNVSGGGVIVRYQSTASPFPAVVFGTITAGQTQTFVFVGQYGADSAIDFRNLTTGTTVSLDNISVREINPLAVSIQMDGRITFADQDENPAHTFVRWFADSNNRINHQLLTAFGTGEIALQQVSGGVFDQSAGGGSTYSPDILVPFNFAGRHGSNFVQGAADGTAFTADTTPVALPDLSATNLQLGFDYNGTIRTFRIWGQDIGDAGLVEATEPSLVPSLSLTFDGTENSFVVLDWSE